MRLTPAQHTAIAETFRAVFGEGRILLFGSRVDDARRGGDIDLYVISPTPEPAVEQARKRIAFLAQLKRRIGAQRIDLVLASEPPRPIDLIALSQGITLCQTP